MSDLPLRQDSKKRRGDNRKDNSEEKHPAVDGSFGEARNSRRRGPYESADAKGCQQDSERSTENSEQQTFGKHLTRQPRPRGAQGGANRGFSHAPGNARQQQAREIDAHDKENRADCGEQEEQALTRRAEHLRSQGNDLRA